MKDKRKPISKATRFEVFKRDGFQCAYCGRTPPAVILEVDHVDPKHNGGSDDINNLITACFDCNRGKRHVPLDKIPAKVGDNLSALKEREEQLHEYNNYIAEVRKRKLLAVAAITELFEKYYPGKTFSTEFKEKSLRIFAEHLPMNALLENLELANARVSQWGEDKVILYFCKVCWNEIKGVRP